MQMIIEHTYDNKKICYQCKWLEVQEEFSGQCKCPYNKVKNRNRSFADKKCLWKNADKS